MGSAIGNSSAGRDRGSHVYDVRDFGAVATPIYNAANAIANTLAFQQAIDTASAQRGPLGGGMIYVPSGDWYLQTPVFLDKDNITLQGEGQLASILHSGGSCDIFIVAMTRQPTGAPATVDHFPDAFTGGPGGVPVYDATAVTALGQRWGIRTKADSHFGQQGGPLDRGRGDGYRVTRKLTISMFIDFTRSGTTIPPGRSSPFFPGSGSVMGMVTANYGTPWMMFVSNGYIYLSLTVVDVNGLNPLYFYLGVYAIPVTPGLVKLDIQIDLVNAQISTYANGVQTVAGPRLAGFTAAANLYFLTNEINPFVVGSTKETLYGVSDAIGGPIDCTFWGLKICDDLIYTNRNTAGTNDNAGVGTTQTRLDAAAITDYGRYFAWEGPKEICRLLLQDSPAAIGLNSLLTVTHYDVIPTYAFFCDNVLAGTVQQIGITIEDLGFSCGNPNYGRGIAVGAPWTFAVKRCNFSNGHQNIGAINVTTNYPIVIEDCNFSSTDACIYLHVASGVIISRCTFNNAVAQIRLFGCNARIEHCFCTSQSHPDYNIWAKDVSILDIFQFAQDAEGLDGGPAKAMVYAAAIRAGNTGGPGCILKIDTLGGGRLMAGSALVILEDGSPEDGYGNRTGRFTMVNNNVEDNFCTTVVRNNGQRWRGEILASTTHQRPTWIENTDVTGQGNVVSIHDNFIGVPRDGTWGKNANILKVVQPAAGQFTEWRCTGTGSYGTAAPPTWFGLLPIDDGLSLAAYLQDNTYWASPAMPAKGQGFWSDRVMPLFLGAIFGGPMPATPTACYVGLAIRQAFRNQTVFEMGGDTYARAVAGVWTLTGAGAANAFAITFPTAGADWSLPGGSHNVFNSLPFFDAPTGGNCIGIVDIAPRTITAGQTVSYAAGALTAGRAASSLGSFADSIHAKMNGLWFNRVPFTAPTIFLALSTSPASLSAPVEPSGGGYGRLPTTAATWARDPRTDGSGSPSTLAIVTNALPLTFAAPTAGWGTAQSVYLMDAGSGGNVLGSTNLAIPRTILSGSPARSFAVGALWFSRS